MLKVPAPVLAVFMRVEDVEEDVEDGKVSFDARRLRIFMNPFPTPFPPDCGDEKTLNEVGGATPPSLALRAISGRRNVDLFDGGEAILADLVDEE